MRSRSSWVVSKYAFAAVLLPLWLWGCATPGVTAAPPPGLGEQAAQPPERAPGPVLPPGEAQLGDRTLCPVTGNVMRVGEDTPSAEHAGKTYYLCCEGCVEEFTRDPERFIGAN